MASTTSKSLGKGRGEVARGSSTGHLPAPQRAKLRDERRARRAASTAPNPVPALEPDPAPSPTPSAEPAWDLSDAWDDGGASE